jgi:membrane-associated phospholipid phosphatase
MGIMQEIVDTFIENPLLSVGYYGPIFLMVINIYVLYHRFFWCIVYILFVVINTFLNKALKIWIKEPRPKGWKAFGTFERLEKEESYGMPSGHAQSAMFSVMFYYLLFGIDEILYIMFFISGLTLFQRAYNKNHTFTQLFIGLIIGGLFSYIVYYFAKKYKNKILL